MQRDAIRMTDDPSESFIRAIRPRRGWIHGIVDAARIKDERRYIYRALAIVVGVLTLAEGLGLILHIIWHPLFMLCWMLALGIASHKLGYVPLQISASTDADIVKQAKADVRKYIADKGRRLPPEDVEKIHAMMERGDSLDRECLMRLAALSHQTGNFPDDHLMQVGSSIIARIDALRPPEAEPEPIDRSAILVKISGTDSADPSVAGFPIQDQTGARLRAIAEKALALEPDLTDAGGALIAPLVRKHLPDLLHAHADAMILADEAGAADAEHALAEGLEKIRLSVEEGLTSSRREASDRLATQVRFLQMRRAGL